MRVFPAFLNAEPRTFLIPCGVSRLLTLLDIVGVLVVLSKGVRSCDRVDLFIDLVESFEASGVCLTDTSAGAEAVVAAESTLPTDSRELL